MSQAPTLSVVVPVYNEETTVPALLEQLVPTLDGLDMSYEILFVDDGSDDGSLGALIAARSQNPTIRVVSFTRNFGKDIALAAGLAHSSGQAVIPIDCDLQHPPSLIPRMVAKWREGNDMVVAIRSNRAEESFLRRTMARYYYRALGALTSIEIPPDAGDFRLLDRKIVDVINEMPERCRFMKGIFAWPGFATAKIEFQAAERANDRSRWSYWRLWRFALDGLFSFSSVPLQIWTYLGVLCAGGAFVYLLITLFEKFVYGIDVPGYASLLIVLLFFNGMALLSNGIQGEYIARIFEEVKRRPLYVVQKTWGFEPPSNVRDDHTENT